MRSSIVLCQIAVEIDGTDAENDTRCFKYRNRHWRPFDFLKDRWEWVLNTYSKVTRTSKFGLEESEILANNDSTLALTYLLKPMSAEDELLPLIFQDHETDTVLSLLPTKGVHQTSKEQCSKYVTTSLYNCLWQAHGVDTNFQSRLPPPLTLPSCFQPTLSGYQARAVHWMLRREQEETKLQPFYRLLFAKDGESQVFKHLYCVHFLEQLPAAFVLPPGGILADEMGLGKTVEVLALILLHQRQDVPHIPACLKTITEADEYYVPVKKSRERKVILCICNRNKQTNKELVKCSKCSQWQHSACLEKDNNKHSKAINEPYLCPPCWQTLTLETSTALVESQATFIVTPFAIRQQWLSEIQRHIKPAPRTLVYEGVVTSGWLSPRQLADYDIVLTDYNTLKRDIYHTAEYESSRVTRNKRRFMRLPTPLLMVRWWRVCLDEGQMVESDCSKLAALVHKLPAVNRWAVTGTPIQRSIDDLYHLLHFVGFTAACEPKAGWHNLVNDFVTLHKQEDLETAAQRPLVRMLQHCMWRTSKTQVLNELHIPPQTELLHQIELGDLERLFYTELHAECEQKFNEAVCKYIPEEGIYPEEATHISPQIMKQLLMPVLRLRQSCNMPVVKQNKWQNGTNAQKYFLEPKELHDHLKSSNELECKSELRSMASSYNGMAAVHFIRKNYDEAIKYYQLVLRLASDYAEKSYNVDSLLQIHALYNIVQAFHSSPKHAATLTQGQINNFEQRCHALEWKYLTPCAAQLTRTKQAAKAACNSYSTLLSQTECTLCDYVSDVIEGILADEQYELQLMDKLQYECWSLFVSKPMQSARGVLYVVSKWWDKVTETQQVLSVEFEELSFFTENVRAREEVSDLEWCQMLEFTAKVYDCHLSELREITKDANKSKTPGTAAGKRKQELCKLCQLKDKLNNYECLLFQKTIDKETNETDGLALPSKEIQLVKAILSFAKASHLPHIAIGMFDKQLENIDCLQNMWKKWVKFWIEIEYTVKAFDELDMCKMRMSLTKDEDERTNFRVMAYELDEIHMEQQANLHKAQHQFTLKLARLKYIMHLEDNVDLGACPICQSDEDLKYVVLECGHHICLRCLKKVQKHSQQSHKLTCAICRNQQSFKKIYYVTRTSSNRQHEFIKVVGDYSSKITFIVRLILKLCSEQRKFSDQVAPPKILIFSQWHPILQAIAAALAENKVRHRLQCTPRTIDEFKNPDLGITCLLMTFAQGSKGLNLIEANHVFLVEPILNPSEELQAIGRVHRFGQTQPTTVHRFIVNGSIEENVYDVVSNGTKLQANWEFDNTSMSNLRDLFKLKNDLTKELSG